MYKVPRKLPWSVGWDLEVAAIFPLFIIYWINSQLVRNKSYFLLCFISEVHKMVAVEYTYPGCTLKMSDVANSDALDAMLLQIHGSFPTLVVHQMVVEVTRLLLLRLHLSGKNILHPFISAGSSTEAWSYFSIRWRDYAIATKTTGQDCVTQLLECCNEDLGMERFYQRSRRYPRSKNRGSENSFGSH